MAELRRVASLALLTLAALGASWALASGAASETAARPIAPSDLGRVVPVSRALARQIPLPDPQLLRLGAPSVPLALLDASGLTPMRAPRAATVAEALAVNGVEVGPQDRLSSAPDAVVSAGDIIRLTRVTTHDIVVREPLPFTVQTRQDPTLPLGRVVVATVGIAGLADNTYRVEVADGVEAGRTLVDSALVVTPVAEVRRVGTKPAVPVAAPAEIEAIIRAAAARWGADPTQLLRVAWCESRYNPLAYNASGASGLFQFMPRTWAANSVRAGYGGASVFDPVASANTAAYMFGNGQAWQWSCK
ncbi:MAG TPA: G5 domain-containing protein [Candidatus Limnocylindria bacterium]|nr:G5 domain-containing protein [Candidatus Limnocylindria bacterium]